MVGRRWVISALASAALLGGVLLLLSARLQESKEEPMVVIRKISSAAFPPPPPPPTQVAQTKSSAVNLTLAPTPTATQLKVTAIEVPLPELSQVVVVSDRKALSQKLAFEGVGLMESITTFGLEQLDDAPRLLSAINARLPGELTQRGIRQGKLVLHVIIHETGQVELVQVDQSQYPQLTSLVDKIVRQARFSAPRRQGHKVKAEFLWPIKVSS